MNTQKIIDDIIGKDMEEDRYMRCEKCGVSSLQRNFKKKYIGKGHYGVVCPNCKR
jgi:hypothetical protein